MTHRDAIEPITCDDVRDLAAGFVIGALSPADMQRLGAHLSTCTDPHAEIAELGGVVPYLAESLTPVEPPARLRNRILDAVAAEAVASEVRLPAPVSPIPTPVPPRAIESAPSVARRSGPWAGRRPVWAALGIAAVVAVVVLGSWNLQLRATNDELAAYQRGVAAVVQAASAKGAQLAILGDPKGASPAAGVAAVKADGTVAIAMRGLAPTTGTQVYEAWLIASTGAPVPIGGFQVGSGGSGTLTDGHGPTAASVVVALTLEPGPGATAPTGPIVVSGVALAQPG